VQKEARISCDAFIEAVKAGDASVDAFNKAITVNAMTEAEFVLYLEEYLKFLALSVHCSGIGMNASRVDEI
jgi:hypothetical protein